MESLQGRGIGRNTFSSPPGLVYYPLGQSTGVDIPVRSLRVHSEGIPLTGVVSGGKTW